MKRQKNSPFLFDGKIDRKNHRKYRVIQIISILPLLVALSSLYYFNGSIMSVTLFFLFLFMGVLVPQIYLDLIQSHLILKEKIEKIEESLNQQKIS
jgi:hypothetical protein